MLDKIENILENGEVWVIDFLPKRCDNIEIVNEFDELLFRKRIKKLYVKRILSIFTKIAMYYDLSMWLGETRKITLKKYSNYVLGDNVKLSKKISIINRVLMRDETISILLEPINAVLSLSMYNSAILLTNNDEIEFLKQMVESEGLFVWKVEL